MRLGILGAAACIALALSSFSGMGSPGAGGSAIAAPAALASPVDTGYMDGPSRPGTFPDLPVFAYTPGVARCHTLGCIRLTEYDAEHSRPDWSVKARVFAEYGIDPKQHAKYEVDHLIPIEVGGSNDAGNLWPQHLASSPGHPGARSKDRYEDWLGRDIRCAAATYEGRPVYRVTEAQNRIARDWISHAIQDMGGVPAAGG